MIDTLRAREIAGKLFVDKYGLDFVRQNIDKRLFTGVLDKDTHWKVDFELFEKEIGQEANDLESKQIFPDIIMSVLVNKKTEDAEVLQ